MNHLKTFGLELKLAEKYLTLMRQCYVASENATVIKSINEKCLFTHWYGYEVLQLYKDDFKGTS